MEIYSEKPRAIFARDAGSLSRCNLLWEIHSRARFSVDFNLCRQINWVLTPSLTNLRYFIRELTGLKRI